MFCLQEFLDDENSDKFFCYECHVVFNDFQTAEDHDCSPQTTETVSNDDHDSILKTRQEHCFYECIFCQARLKTYGGLQTHQLNCRMKVNIYVHIGLLLLFLLNFVCSRVSFAKKNESFVGSRHFLNYLNF